MNVFREIKLPANIQRLNVSATLSSIQDMRSEKTPQVLQKNCRRHYDKVMLEIQL